MTQEDKQLLLIDLCARLTYNVIGLYSWKNREPHNRELTGCLFDELKSSWDSTGDSQFLPYLRPMSSMTRKEKETYYNLCYEEEREELEFGEWVVRIHYHDTIDSIDYLNSIHIDYRGLIPKGLAFEVTEENNPYKD